MAHSRGIPEPSEYGKFARRILRGYGRRIENADPEDLADLLALSHDVDELIQATITAGRDRWANNKRTGWSWADIARAAGTTRSAAFQRWGEPKVQTGESNPQNGCQHAEEGTTGPASCGAPASEFKLPDGTTGWYCGTHGPRVIERNRRRLALRQPTGGWAAGFAREAAAYRAEPGDE